MCLVAFFGLAVKYLCTFLEPFALFLICVHVYICGSYIVLLSLSGVA